MEQVELALPEDLRQVLEEVSENLLHARSVVLLSVDQLVNVFSGTECIRPNFHLQSDFQLMVSQLKYFLESLLLIKTDWEGNLRLDKELRVLRLLKDLVEVRVKGL